MFEKYTKNKKWVKQIISDLDYSFYAPVLETNGNALEEYDIVSILGFEMSEEDKERYNLTGFNLKSFDAELLRDYFYPIMSFKSSVITLSETVRIPARFFMAHPKNAYIKKIGHLSARDPWKFKYDFHHGLNIENLIDSNEKKISEIDIVAIKGLTFTDEEIKELGLSTNQYRERYGMLIAGMYVFIASFTKRGKINFSKDMIPAEWLLENQNRAKVEFIDHGWMDDHNVERLRKNRSALYRKNKK